MIQLYFIEHVISWLQGQDKHFVQQTNFSDRMLKVNSHFLPDRIKWEFFYAVAMSVLLDGCTPSTLKWTLGSPESGTPQNGSYTATYLPSYKPPK